MISDAISGFEKRKEAQQRPRDHSITLGLMFSVLIAAGTLYPYLLNINVPWFTIHLAKAAVVGLGILYLLYTGRVNGLSKLFELSMTFLTTYILLLAVSLLLWLLALNRPDYIKRGIGVLLYQMIDIMMCFTAVYMLGKNALYYALYGMLLGYALIALSVMRVYGAGEFVSQMMSFYLSAGKVDNTISRAMEVHDVTFAFGLFAIYLLMFEKRSARQIAGFIMSMIAFVLGWKRIAMAALALACAYAFFANRMDKRRARNLTSLVFVGILLFNYAYLIVIKTGLYYTIMERLGINTMGRVQLYKYFGNYYELSPAFSGYGIGYISRMMESLIEQGFAVLNNAMSIHNDILKRYIEMGFWGFFAWNLYSYGVQYLWIRARFSERTMKVFTACVIFTYISYLTDNTIEYYHINTAFRIIPLAVCAETMIDRSRVADSRISTADAWQPMERGLS